MNEDADKNDSIYGSNVKLNAVQEILEDSVVLEESERGSYVPKVSPVLRCISNITENLLLSSATAADVGSLRHINVTCVINAAAELPDTPLHNKNIHYYRVSVHDLPSADIISCFESVLDIMHKEISNKGTILIHCVAGISRSATICIAYLMKYHQMSLLQAYNHVKLKRPVIRPNCGFFEQLIEYEKTLHGASSVNMIYNEAVKMVIPDVYDCEYKHILNYRRKRRDSVRHH